VEKSDYEKRLFSEFRYVAVKSGEKDSIDEENMIRAITVNEELVALGYTLSPAGIVMLAKSPDLCDFYEKVKGLIGGVKAAPMYPNFPKEVMKIDAAKYRFHQILHYLSTYGVELMGGEVKKGWLPNPNSKKKTKCDYRLLDAKVIELIDINDFYIRPFRKILSKNERMTSKECDIVYHALIEGLLPEQISTVNVPFKQNLLEIFNHIFINDAFDTAQKYTMMKSLCHHTGDVFKCMDYALTHCGFHLRTSEKRLFVRLLESYSIYDFRSNLIISNKKATRTILMLKYIDYNEYSRNPEHKRAVAELRNGELRSWESMAKHLLTIKSDDALEYVGKHPGQMLRMITYMLRMGYEPDAIRDELMKSAENLSIQTLCNILKYFGRNGDVWRDDERYAEAKTVYSICEPLMEKRLSAVETPFRNKKIYIDSSGYDFKNSVIQTNDKAEEGGYVRSGIAYKIPDTVERLRFFVYWNDMMRVDVDLHAGGLDKNGKAFSIGWDSEYIHNGVVYSGDITHSDAAEYIDVDLSDNVSIVWLTINLYSGRPYFGDIDECFTGCLGVKELNEEIKLYDPKNCFFSHNLTGNFRYIDYGYIDVDKRILVFKGISSNFSLYYNYTVQGTTSFSLARYLDILCKSQNAEITENRDEADNILIMEKPTNEKEISIIDNNFFM
jgi:hypothetical protein